MNYDEIDQLFVKSYLQPTKEKPFHFLYNTENSIKIFDRIKTEIFTFNVLLKKIEKSLFVDKYYIKNEDVDISYDENNYKECLITGKEYEQLVSLEIQIYKTRLNKKTKKLTTEIISSFVIDIKIPIYVGYGGVSDHMPIIQDMLQIGGFFIGKNNVKKYVVFKEDRTCTWPKIDLLKMNIYHLSYNSIPMQFENRLDKPQYLVVDMDLNFNKIKLIISSKKSLPDYNLIILISFLTRLPINLIKENILSRFENKEENVYYDNRIVDIINILFYQAEDILKMYTSNKDSMNPIEKYIKVVYSNFYEKNNFGSVTKEEFFRSMFIETLLPGINSLNFLKTISKNQLLYLKGRQLLNILEDFLISIFQNDIYPDKYHFSNRRIASPGSTFTTIAIELVKNIISDFKDQIEKELKNNHGDENITLTPSKKNQNVFNNTFNMQDKKHSIVIKLQKNTNYAQKIFINNLVVWDSPINLTKFMNTRDPNMISFHYLGPVDTPDHGKRVGINRRLNVGTIINDKDFTTHRKLVEEIYIFIQNYIKKKSKKIKTQLEPDIINISLVDESESWIGCIEQELGLELYTELIEKKISNIFCSNLIDISIIPYYTETKLKIFLPIKKYRKIRINIGNKIPFMPAYIVKNGKLLIDNVELINDLKKNKLDFDIINKKYNCIEFLGPEQITYTNMCESLSTFINLDQEKRKIYHYVSMDNTLNLSIIENMIFDISKMPGPRSIFSVSQFKNGVSSVQPDQLNVLENEKFSIGNIQEPCITNDILIASNIHTQSFGSHVYIAFMAYNDNIEDSIIVNQESVNNGLFLMINMLLFKGEVDIKNTQNNMINIKKIQNSYKKLDANGLPQTNMVLEYGDALYSNTEAIKKTNNTFYLQDNSIPYKFLIPGRIDRVLILEYDTFVKLKYNVAVVHHLERGHKISNQCAQKATVSKIAPLNELPYTYCGKRPDMILNPLSILSRKTFNMSYQVIISNYFNYLPHDENGIKRYINYKSFSNNNHGMFKNMINNLKEKYPDYSESKINDIFYCNELMFDPDTGEMLKIPIFYGPIYFTRQIQIPEEKISAKNKGKVNKLNQPPGGKQKGGSHRIGEMENDLLITHGCTNMIYEISRDPIDMQTQSLVCTNCTSVATKIKTNNQSYYTCINCQNMGITSNFEIHELTKSVKTLIQTLNFRGVSLNITYNDMGIIYPEN